MGLEMSECCCFQRFYMSSFKQNFRCKASYTGLFPARRAEAPAITGNKARKAELGTRGGKVIAARLREFEEIRSHYGADCVAALVIAIGVAAAIPVPASEWIH